MILVLIAVANRHLWFQQLHWIPAMAIIYVYNSSIEPFESKVPVSIFGQ